MKERPDALPEAVNPGYSVSSFTYILIFAV